MNIALRKQLFGLAKSTNYKILALVIISVTRQ